MRYKIKNIVFFLIGYLLVVSAVFVYETSKITSVLFVSLGVFLPILRIIYNKYDFKEIEK